MKPNLFIVGAPKCGTTAWVKYLGEHPEIYFSKLKEPHYFALDLPGIRAVHSAADYEALFAQSGGAAITGEASVMYLFSTSAAQGIREYSPDARVLIFLRKQRDFLPSLHHQFLYTFQESLEDFEQAWRLSGQRGTGTIPKTCREPKLLNYKAMGCFSEQVERYLSIFPASHVRVFRFEEWAQDPRSAYLDVLSFLGLPDDGRKDFEPVNEAKRHRFDALGRILQHPPSWLLPAIRMTKRMVGTDSLGLAEFLTSINKRSGYRSRIAAQVEADIDSWFLADNCRLEELLNGARPTT